MIEDKFKREYMLDITFDENREEDSVRKRNRRHNKCGMCSDFDNGCTTSEIERKYGDANTPACSEFK